MKRLLVRMLDETEFLSDYGVRPMSRVHASTLTCSNRHERFSVGYEPGESSQTYMFGGNSNWRGPIWFPINYLIIESLERFHGYYGDDFLVECPTGSGRQMPLRDVADEISVRLTKLFLRNEHGARPIHGRENRLQADPHFSNYVWFHEYFHGDTGRGAGCLAPDGLDGAGRQSAPEAGAAAWRVIRVEYGKGYNFCTGRGCGNQSPCCACGMGCIIRHVDC